MDAPAVAAIHRHPVKALGSEALERAALTAGATLPGDRVWALAHERSRYDFDAPGWARCTTFLRGAAVPTLMAVTAEGAPGGPITFRHPDAEPLTADPGTAEGEAAFVAWAAAIVPPGTPAPARLTPAIGRGMTDQPNPWISILSDASRAALSEAAGRPLARRRFRGNLWLAGTAPWAESDWIGREIAVGDVRLRVTEPIERCNATHVDPDTGRPDADLLDVLRRLRGNADFGVFAEVLSDGEVAVGDPVALA